MGMMKELELLIWQYAKNLDEYRALKSEIEEYLQGGDLNTPKAKYIIHLIEEEAKRR